MENNEENVGSKGPSTNFVEKLKAADTKTIVIAVAALVIVIGLFCAIFTRSAKSTVKDYVNAMINAKAKKMYNLMDLDGRKAFNELKVSYNSDKKEYEYDFSNFDELYKKAVDERKKMSKEDKDKEKEEWNKQIDEMQKALEKAKDDRKENKEKIKIKSIKTSKVSGTKKVTKVEVKLEMKNKDGDINTETETYYTMKKGLKNYIISE